MPEYKKEFGGKVYKISEDEHGNRVTHLKITGGEIAVKNLICYNTDGVDYEEKISYAGFK